MHVQTCPLHTVSIRVKSRVVTVTGPRGSLSKSFRHMDMELTKVGKNKLRVDIWFAKRKQLACLQTICGHLKNMFKGVLYVSVITQCSLSAWYLGLCGGSWNWKVYLKLTGGGCAVNKGVPSHPPDFQCYHDSSINIIILLLHSVGA